MFTIFFVGGFVSSSFVGWVQRRWIFCATKSNTASIVPNFCIKLSNQTIINAISINLLWNTHYPSWTIMYRKPCWMYFYKRRKSNTFCYNIFVYWWTVTCRLVRIYFYWTSWFYDKLHWGVDWYVLVSLRRFASAIRFTMPH